MGVKCGKANWLRGDGSACIALKVLHVKSLSAVQFCLIASHIVFEMGTITLKELLLGLRIPQGDKTPYMQGAC